LVEEYSKDFMILLMLVESHILRYWLPETVFRRSERKKGDEYRDNEEETLAEVHPYSTLYKISDIFGRPFNSGDLR